MSEENVAIVQAIQPVGRVDLVELFREGPSAMAGPADIEISAFSGDADIEFVGQAVGPLRDRRLTGVEGLIEPARTSSP